MSTLVDQIQEHGLTNENFTGRQLSEIIDGTDARRYGLVNRALKEGVLVRLKPGLYCLSNAITKTEFLPHPFGIAQAIVPRSYISFSTALRFHDWIPEAVYTTSIVTPKSKSSRYRQEVLGWFTFRPLAVNKEGFLEGVTQYRFGKQVVLVADPLRAVMDIVERNKQPWTGIDYIQGGLRVEDEDFLSLKRKDFAKLKKVYKRKSTTNFLANFEQTIFQVKSRVAD